MSKGLVAPVSASVRQKIDLFQPKRAPLLEAFLKTQTKEERDAIQAYAMDRRHAEVGLAGGWFIVQSVLNMSILTIDPVALVGLPFLAVPAGYYGWKRDKFDAIQTVFDKVDAENKKSKD